MLEELRKHNEMVQSRILKSFGSEPLSDNNVADATKPLQGDKKYKKKNKTAATPSKSAAADKEFYDKVIGKTT